jgi:CRP/FNR family cyclic AMP-dependent transcriptional regulator
MVEFERTGCTYLSCVFQFEAYPMACEIEVLKRIPLFELLDEEEAGVLAAQVDLRRFAPRQRIYKMGDAGGRAYVLLSGSVRVTTVDEDHQEVIVDEPLHGEFFGFASMLDQTPHRTNATAIEDTQCIEVDREDIAVLLTRKPHAGMDMLTVLGKQFHASQELVRKRANRNANEMIEDETSFGEHIADEVAQFGGSWKFIILFGVVLVAYTLVSLVLGPGSWDPYPFILLNLFLSMLAAIQAPVIMMSQNRQDSKDRLRSELDFDVNRRAEAEIQGLSRKMHLLNDKMDDLEELLREDLDKRPKADRSGKG